ncbi:IS701 family transposase [Myceligenerans halotolerans]
MSRAQALERLVSGLPRADQRRWARIYVDRLARLEGELGSRTLVSWIAQNGGGADHSLQRFLNRSHWDPDHIRRAIADVTVEQFGVEAWVVRDVVFAKHGTQSPGVERQYVYEHKKVVNCQKSLALCLVTDRSAVPVNWHLRIPQSWHASSRRDKAGIPGDEIPASRDALVVRLLDETSAWETVPSRPVVCRGENPAECTALTARLAAHAYQFVVAVEADTPSLPDSADVLQRDAAAQQRPARGLADIVRQAAPAKVTVTWQLRHGAVARGQFALVPVRLPVKNAPALRLRALVEWPPGKAVPVALWLTNIEDAPIQRLVAIARLARVGDQMVEQLQSRFALEAFEGRTFHGWHHHVALVSAAYTLWLGWCVGTGESTADGVVRDPGTASHWSTVASIASGFGIGGRTAR